VRPITIRNATADEVRFTVSAPGAEAEVRSLEAGAADTLATPAALVVTYERSGLQLEHRLDPGSRHTFRSDAAGRLGLYRYTRKHIDEAVLAPFVPTPLEVVQKMLEMAEVGPADVLYDLGCGDGRIVIAAAEQHGARGVGLDIDPDLIVRALVSAKKAGMDGLVKFRVEDATTADISAATVVALYLTPRANEQLRPRLEAQLRPGARVVAHDFQVPGWEQKLVLQVRVHAARGSTHRVFLYRR